MKSGGSSIPSNGGALSRFRQVRLYVGLTYEDDPLPSIKVADRGAGSCRVALGINRLMPIALGAEEAARCRASARLQFNGLQALVWPRREPARSGRCLEHRQVYRARLDLT